LKPLDADRIFGSSKSPVVIGAGGEVLESVPSTMDVGRERLLAGGPDGYVVLTEHQAAGRGREGAWECPHGVGILMSVALTMGLPANEQKLIVLMGAVAAAETARAFGVPALIKWPNDLVVTTRCAGELRIRKFGGLLAERVARGDAAPAHILGIGLNVNQTEVQLPLDATPKPTSMRLERGRELDRSNVCRALLQELDVWYRRLAMEQGERILARWRLRSCLLGEQVNARVGGLEVSGKVVGIRSSGELILEDTSGRQLFLSDEKTHLLL